MSPAVQPPPDITPAPAAMFEPMDQDKGCHLFLEIDYVQR
jgi:hypothetical protein